MGAVLPNNRVVAYYGIPGAAATGPAYHLTEPMYQRLKRQGAAYERLDPAHPVKLGIDLVSSVPDGFPGDDGTYHHRLTRPEIMRYLRFCERHDLLLFLDLNFGQAKIMPEVRRFLPYLEKYDFVHLAVDPEWMFPRHNGIPGVNLSNVRSGDLNPIIDAVAQIPEKYHMPRKILMIHQYRGDGDGTADPYSPGQAEIADKRNLQDDARVDVVIACDGVGGFAGDHESKTHEYKTWVSDAMKKYHNFRYGGFKLFYQLEKPTGVMRPATIMRFDPQPMVITYGN
ncbi:MAG: hypothetical protein WCA46_09810 [Actinocatenispora sp.]